MTQRIDTITPQIQQLLWLNKDSIQRVVATTRRGGNGALIVEQSIIPSGIPIEIGTKDAGMLRSDFEALQQHNATNLTTFELVMDDDTFTVFWDNTGGPAVTGEDVFDLIGGYSTLKNVTLKFLTAE
ncbi:hypothetical protein PY479_05160 [Shewanella sp. A32]|uniref:hypothetical protein n=1 Tax=Shewanella sp. A32 TaxID=3031327 RepID=UPI0023B99E72|nr:hypothetical protein [Shewanella sp. A32]MDF0533668.1 hypothetical protein [Shewanella sp. A32]